MVVSADTGVYVCVARLQQSHLRLLLHLWVAYTHTYTRDTVSYQDMNACERIRACHPWPAAAASNTRLSICAVRCSTSCLACMQAHTPHSALTLVWGLRFWHILCVCVCSNQHQNLHHRWWLWHIFNILMSTAFVRMLNVFKFRIPIFG
jgi:hypothetical protein